MRVLCGSCNKALEFSGDRPSFCAYCGISLSGKDLANTATYRERTSLGEEHTLIPPENRVARFLGVALESPERIGGYRISRSLGSGGMGTVYEAEDAAHGRQVAIKVIKPHIAASAENLERFRQEGRLASLIAHPRCVFVYHADEEQGRPYIVMEKMPGATLKDIVTSQGRLGVGQAINKVLDILDGLQAAHAIGVIHRDVKPSNCFVLSDGHVKVGDFGLSKFLPTPVASTAKRTDTPHTGVEAVIEDEERITRTGAFVGTPLFASPEQIKGEIVDYRTDVYSTAATLYYLLSGKAPFEGSDNTATIARIVSEDPSPLSEVRADIPPELDRVILRGLERNRELRYSSLAEFRQALQPFLPGYLQPARRPARLRAAVVDAAILTPAVLLSYQVMPHLLSPARWGSAVVDFVGDLFLWVIVLGYFFATEVAAGASFGKWLLRLRVGGLRPGKPPRRRQLMLRTLGFFVIVALPGILGLVLTGSDAVKWGLHGVGLLLLVDTMRAKGGYRGLHEILSRTCVVQLPVPPRALQFPIFPPREAAPLPPGLPDRIGNYAIQGIHRVLDDRIFLEGTDLVLDRQVWLVLRPKGEGKIPPARREVTRTSRLRWLGGGEVAVRARSHKTSHHWDAYLAPTTGCSLTQLVGVKGPLPWAVSRTILLQLAEELATALSDGTFPDELGTDQIWLQPDGQIMIIGARFQSQGVGEEIGPGSEKERAMTFLRQAARFMLEGKHKKVTKPRRIEAPVPAHDRPVLDRLAEVSNETYASPAELMADLRAGSARPAEITLSSRLGQILLHSALLSPVLLAILVVGRFYHEIKPTLRLTHQVMRADRVIGWLGTPENRREFIRYLNEHPAEQRRLGAELYLVIASMTEAGGVPEAGNTLEEIVTEQYLKKVKEQQGRDRQALETLKRQLSFAAMAPTVVAVELMPSPEERPVTNRAEAAGPYRGVLEAALEHAFDEHRTNEERLPLVQNRNEFQLARLVIGSWFVVWVVWAMVTNGGFSLRLMGIDLQNRRGRRAGPLRCGLRSFAVWLPFFALLFVSVGMQDLHKGMVWDTKLVFLYWTPWWLAVIYLATCALWALVRPQRGPHDRLSGVYLMPR